MSLAGIADDYIIQLPGDDPHSVTSSVTLFVSCVCVTCFSFARRHQMRVNPCDLLQRVCRRKGARDGYFEFVLVSS